MAKFTVPLQFLGLFGQTARYHHRYKVFSDFVQCCAIAIHNRFCPGEELEQSYMAIIKSYEREDVERLVPSTNSIDR